MELSKVAHSAAQNVKLDHVIQSGVEPFWKNSFDPNETKIIIWKVGTCETFTYKTFKRQHQCGQQMRQAFIDYLSKITINYKSSAEFPRQSKVNHRRWAVDKFLNYNVYLRSSTKFRTEDISDKAS